VVVFSSRDRNVNIERDLGEKEERTYRAATEERTGEVSEIRTRKEPENAIND